MAGVYRPRHPERTVLYRVLFHYFDRFLVEYEGRFEKEDGFLRPIIKENVPHRQVVFTIPKMLRIFFKYKRRLLGDLCRCALRSLTRYFEVVTGGELMLGVIAAIQTFGNRMNPHPHLHFLVTEGGRGTPHIPDKGQVTVRYYGLYANAHRGKVKKASRGPFPLRMVEEELRPFPSRGWAEMIRKVYEVDPMGQDPIVARHQMFSWKYHRNFLVNGKTSF